MEPLPASVLPSGVRSRILRGINGLDIHVLEAGYEEKGRPAVLLLHGFPELAYSWRKVLPALAAAGYHAMAPDHRGYGRTTGWDADFDGDVASFRFMNLLRDAIGVLFALASGAFIVPMLVMALSLLIVRDIIIRRWGSTPPAPDVTRHLP